MSEDRSWELGEQIGALREEVARLRVKIKGLEMERANLMLQLAASNNTMLAKQSELRTILRMSKGEEA